MAKSRPVTKRSVNSGQRELLAWALQGLEQEIATTRQRLQELEARAKALRGTTRGALAVEAPATPAAAAPKKAGKKRKISPEGRKRIAEAQKRRWAKARAGKE